MTVTCVSSKSEFTNIRNNMGLEKYLKIGVIFVGAFFSECKAPWAQMMLWECAVCSFESGKHL